MHTHKLHTLYLTLSHTSLSLTLPLSCMHPHLDAADPERPEEQQHEADALEVLQHPRPVSVPLDRPHNHHNCRRGHREQHDGWVGAQAGQLGKVGRGERGNEGEVEKEWRRRVREGRVGGV